MVIEINKDIDKYKESVVLGLTAKQLIYSLLSVAVGGGLVFLIYPIVGLTASAYIVIPVVAPIALGGFYSYNGMSFYEMMSKKIHFMFGDKPLLYVSTENEGQIKKYYLDQLAGKKKSDGEKVVDAAANKEEFEKTKKQMKRMLIGTVVMIGIIVAMAVAYKMGIMR